ncbi:replicative DNA helicase [Streptomyces globisporus]|uniref:replicative DNA helicase n=1 Tax=Streptomyces globisporus TaxID=1908 RepID=UPI003460F0FD
MSIPQQTADAPPAHVYDEEPPYGEEPRSSRAQQTYDRVPPNDIDAEQSALGGMLLSKDAIGAVSEELSGPEDFYRPAHQTVYTVILDLYARGEPADPITVAAELVRRGELGKVGGAPYLHTLVQCVPTAANAGYYAAGLAETARFRRLAEAGTRITQAGYRGEGDSIDVIDQAQTDLMSVVGSRAGQAEAPPLSATSAAMLDRIEQRKYKSGDLVGLATGFADLDALTLGLRPGQLIIVAARPAVGKSTLAVDFARQCSVVNKIPSVVFSLEMDRENLEERILSATARVALHHIQSGEVTEEDWTRIARKMPDIDDSPLIIDDSADKPSYTEIAAKARRYVQKSGIKLIIIDYLQLMKSSSKKNETRQEEVADISRNLKLLAKSLGVPIVALSQLNRGPEQRTDKKPMISDLRESGAIEQDADVVILLHREDAYDKESARAGEADLIVAKHRNGPTATITVAFQGHYARFTDMNQT